MLMTSFSILSSAAAFEYIATPTVTTRLTLTRVDVPMRLASRYGDDGTTAANGTIGASGTES